MRKSALLFGSVLLVCQLTNSSLAQKGVVPPEPANPPYPGDSQITFQWNYTCPEGQACSFTCPGASGGSRVKRLDLYLGSILGGNNQRSAAIFYDFSTEYFPRNNGFTISTGIGVLSCQVNGMRLDYSGPPKM
jgi:hypothetical protein